MSLLNTPRDALNLHSRLKFSAYERDLALFLTDSKAKTKDVDELL